MLLIWSGSNPPPPPADCPSCSLDGSRKLACILFTLLGSKDGIDGLLPPDEEEPDEGEPDEELLLDPPLVVLLDPPLEDLHNKYTLMIY